MKKIHTNDFDADDVNWTEADAGKVVDIHNQEGSYYDERIVHVYCSVCGSTFVGPTRQAGGFLGGHEVYHTWQYQQEMGTELEA
jgi:hypothetical protein